MAPAPRSSSPSARHRLPRCTHPPRGRAETASPATRRNASLLPRSARRRPAAAPPGHPSRPLATVSDQSRQAPGPVRACRPVCHSSSNSSEVDSALLQSAPPLRRCSSVPPSPGHHFHSSRNHQPLSRTARPKRTSSRGRPPNHRLRKSPNLKKKRKTTRTRSVPRASARSRKSQRQSPSLDTARARTRSPRRLPRRRPRTWT